MYCCFTGHRPESLPWICKENSSECIKLKKVLENVIEEAISDGYTDFYCGMARGIDTYAAEIIAEKMKYNKKIHLHAALPCPNQCDSWNEADKLRYKKLLDLCTDKSLISPVYTPSCMLTRNRFMVDNSQRVIAVWNGYFRGGTAYTIRYAKSQNKELYILRPKDASLKII